MVKKASGGVKATAASAAAGAGSSARQSKTNLSTPGSIKTAKFKKWKAKANCEKAAAVAAAPEEVISVGAGTGGDDASIAVASTVAPVLKLDTNAEGSVPALTPAIAETSASASASAAKPKPKPKLAVVDAATATSKDKGVAADNGDGDGRMRNRKERVRKKALNGMGKEMAENGGMKGKMKAVLGKKEERDVSKGAGFIFMCNSQTKQECYQNRLFGMPSAKIGRVQKIKPGAKLFLYDFDLKLLYGVYKAASNGGMNLVQKAFHGKFPAQVKFKIDKDCLPLPESSFKQAIKENYSGKSRFDPELNSRQVQSLIALFKPANAPQSVPKNHLEDRRHYEYRRQPYHFEERRPSLPVEEVREPWFDEERRPAVIHVPHEDPYIAPRFATLPVEPRLDQGDRHIYYQPAHVAPEPQHIPLVDSLHVPMALERHHVPSVPEPRHVSPAYYHNLASSDDSYYRSAVDLVPERYPDRTVGEITARDPIIPRDHTRLPGEISARRGRLEELYWTGGTASRGAHLEELYSPGEMVARADHVGIATRADRLDELYRSDHHATRAVDLPRHSTYPTSAYETNPAYAERHVSARANAPGAPVSSHYSFAGGPVYR